jgi:HEAT repeat protein
VVAQTKDDVPGLIKQLKDKDEIVRLKAAKTLGKLGADAKEAIPALTEALKDSDDDVRSVAKQALAKIKEAVDAADKDQALNVLTRHIKDSKSSDRDVRAKAVLGLAKLLSSDDEIIRMKAAKALGEAGLAAQPALKQLNEAAKDSDEIVRREARKAITAIETAVAEEKKGKALEKLAPLLKELKDKSPAVRQKALEKIADLGPDGAAASEQVIGSLADKVPGVQQSALDALEKINPTLHKPIVTLLVDRDINVKLDAIHQLGKLGSDARPAIPLLISFFHTQNLPGLGQHYFGIGILDALKAIDPENKDYIELLLNAIRIGPNSPSHVRIRAIEHALDLVQSKKLDTARLVKPLVSALNDLGCRLQAIKALGELGVDAKDAIPTLKKLKLDPDKTTRETVEAALKKIE